MAATKCAWTGAVLLAVGGLLFGGSAAHAQDKGSVEITETDVSAYPTVTALVTAPAGLSGAGYPAEAFEVLESDTPVPFTVERVSTTNLEIVLVIDTSGSMDGLPLQAAKAAAVDFLALLPPEVQVGVVGFGPAPTVVTPLTIDRGITSLQLSQLYADGETALYDAVILAAAQFSPGATDRAIVLLSDGGDTVSEAPLENAVFAAAGVRLNVIELVSEESNRAVLDQLAASGGGQVTSSSDPAALSGLYRSTASALANQYRIGYTSSGHGRAPLTIRVTTPTGVLEATRPLDLPLAPATAEAPVTTTAAIEDTVRRPDEAPAISVLPTPDATWLAVGAGVFFVALFLLGLIGMPEDPRGRLARAQIGLKRGLAETPSMSQVGERMTGATERFLERRGRRTSLARALETAGITLRPGEFVLLSFVAAIVGSLAGLALLGRIGVVAALVIVPLAARAIVERKARQRREGFAEQLPDTLQLLTASLRAGYGVMQALDTLAQEALEPARTEFTRVVLETRVGRDLSESLRALAERMASADFEWVVGAIDISREVGGDLAQILDTVGETIRERQRLFRQVQALTAEGRVSAYILIALPFVMAGLLRIINPDSFAILGTGAGLAMVLVGSGLLAVGWIWMRRLIRLEY
ncbi:MAG: type II secretion system F family protein [Acidimicrobiia bacterium]